MKSPIEQGRINRRAAIASGVATVGLTLLPRLRGELTPIPEISKRYDAEFIGTMALKYMQQVLPKAHRAYAGFGHDGDLIVLDGEEYELQLLYTAFGIYDSEMPEVTTERLIENWIEPSAKALARIFTLQPDLKHLVTRRIEPVDAGRGMISKFMFQDYLGLRCTIAYEAFPMETERGRLTAIPDGRNLYVLEMLAGVQKNFVKTLAEINGYANEKNVGA